ncbi:zf-TFIIB domain-containing protein [Chloroflexota bacterium]
MICPNENVEMQQVKVESHYGQTVILDQCPKCGGIWFDHFELYSVKQGQAEKIESFNVDTLRTSSQIGNSEFLCPRDSGKLIHFSDPFFPKDIIIASCPVCNGFWLNRGEFIKYQNYRQSLKKPRETTDEDKKLGQDIARILAEHKNGDATDALGKLGRFLSTPMDSMTWRPLEPEQLSEKEKNAINLIINALLVILRFFIRI